MCVIENEEKRAAALKEALVALAESENLIEHRNFAGNTATPIEALVALAEDKDFSLQRSVTE